MPGNNENSRSEDPLRRHQCNQVNSPPNCWTGCCPPQQPPTPEWSWGRVLGRMPRHWTSGTSCWLPRADPVTFATDRAGWYAVQVCANDVACTGATPRWFLATLLVPDWFSSHDAAQLFEDVVSACQQLSVSLIGGHSEVTHGIDRPTSRGDHAGGGRPGTPGYHRRCTGGRQHRAHQGACGGGYRTSGQGLSRRPFPGRSVGGGDLEKCNAPGFARN